jgi:hypothetical protein
MKTSDAPNGRCPHCGAPVSQDSAAKGWVRHLEHCGPCQADPYGRGERDELPDDDAEQES